MHVPGVRGEEGMRSVELFAREVMPASARALLPERVLRNK